MIIMLAGKIKSGKTALSELVVNSNFGFLPVSFADVLKEAYAEFMGISVADLHDTWLKEKYRQGMISYADEIRAENRYFFADLLFERLDSDPRRNYVIDDLRAIEELELGIQRGAKPFFVYAEPLTRLQRGWRPNPQVDTHYLENEMSLSRQTFNALGGDWIYNNTNNMVDLKRKADSFMFEHVMPSI